jgi:acyl-CoA reductase-like NAD-dependent aldehyde dehydrogenase
MHCRVRGMDDITLESLPIEERNRVLDAWTEEIRTDLETIAELEAEYEQLGVQV